MELKMNKRGVFFIFIVIIITSLLIASYTLSKSYQERNTIQKRIGTMNSFLNSIETDFSRQIFISGFRSIFIMEKKILETGVYIDDVELRFEELFMNGTIYGDTDENITVLMNGATFSDIQDSINEKGSKINVMIIMGDPSITLSQEDPWNVKIEIEFNLSMQDLGGLASWNKTERIEAYVPIAGFQDPVYTIESNNPAITNSINITPYSSFDSSSLLIHATESFYKNSSEAPNFISRLEGDIEAEDSTGIESLVYVPGLPASNQYSKSIVDHVYWGSSNPSSCQVSGQSSWFRLDSNHLSDYDAAC